MYIYITFKSCHLDFLQKPANDSTVSDLWWIYHMKMKMKICFGQTDNQFSRLHHFSQSTYIPKQIFFFEQLTKWFLTWHKSESFCLFAGMPQPHFEVLQELHILLFLCFFFKPSRKYVNAVDMTDSWKILHHMIQLDQHLWGLY